MYFVDAAAWPYTEQALPGVEDISSEEGDSMVEWTTNEEGESSEEGEEENILERCLESENGACNILNSQS